MTGEDWRAVKAIVGGALDLPPAERPGYVATRCGGDGALRAEVESLLTHAVSAGDRYEVPLMTTGVFRAALHAEDPGLGSMVGRHIGAYKVVAEIGRGGMGAAFLGERADRAFQRQVAIKVIKRGMDTDGILRRFLHERQILASLSHPNIATLLDGGTTDDDRPYFVMEYIDGAAITEHCDRQRLPVVERLKLVVAVCAGVAHAHGQRVIHRDLKPGNILVTRNGVPKLLDFGIAKLLDAQGGGHTGDTVGAPAMTLEYASPEQVKGLSVTPATDVYALGVLLYELLTGINPQRGGGRGQREIERAICEEVPLPPSRAVTAALAESRSATADDLRTACRGGLDAIVMTALAKDPQRRYGSAAALAADIERYLEGHPISARTPTAPARAVARLRGVDRKSAVAAAAIVIAIVAVALSRWTPRPSAGPVTSLAVMPLQAVASPAADVELIAAGITENVIRRLSQASGLKVIGRNSVYRFAGRAITPRDAGRELGVDAVMSGTMAEQAGTLTLQVALIGVADGGERWNARLTRPLSEARLLQADLATTIIERLDVRLTPREQLRAARRETLDAQAYQLYLKGRFFLNKRTPQDLEKSVRHFKEATERDPSYALAFSGLADAYALLTEYHGAQAIDTFGPARDAVTRALTLDDELGEAHASLAYQRHFYEWDPAGAEAAFKRALTLEPTYAMGHQWYAEFLAAMGRHDEARAEIRRATDLDPLSLIAHTVQASTLYYARRYDEAVAAALRVIDMDRNFPEAYEFLKRSYDQMGRYAESVDARQARRRGLGLDATLTPALRAAAAARDRVTYWRSRLEQELLEGRTEGLPTWDMAEILAQAGQIDQALDWIERACREHDFMLLTAGVAPNLDPLRAHPRFQALTGGTCRVTR